MFSLVGVVVERRGVVFFLVGATREVWVMCWGAGGWVLLFPTSRSFEYTSTKWLWVSSAASTQQKIVLCTSTAFDPSPGRLR